MSQPFSGSSGQSLWAASQRRERHVDHWLEHGRASMPRAEGGRGSRGARPCVSTGRSIHAVPSITRRQGEGIEDGRDCATAATKAIRRAGEGSEVLQDCVGTFVDAGSSDSLEKIATHLRGSGIWCSRDSIGHGLVDPDHLPCSGCDPHSCYSSSRRGYWLRSAAGPWR